MNIEYEAFVLADFYYKKYDKYSKKHIPLSIVKKSKYWKYFVNTIEYYGSYEEWNSKKYIDTIFDNFGKVFPQQLPRKDFWQLYLEHFERGEKDNIKNAAMGFLLSYKEIRRWSYKNKYKRINIKAFFEDKKVRKMLRNDYISIYLLAITKSFKEYYHFLDDKEKICPKEKLEEARRFIFFNTNLKNKIKMILKNEFDGRKFI